MPKHLLHHTYGIRKIALAVAQKAGPKSVCERYGFLLSIGNKEDDPQALEQIAKGDNAQQFFSVSRPKNSDRIVVVYSVKPMGKLID